MTGLAILVPVLARPHRVEPLLASIASSTPTGARVVFVVDDSDQAEREAIAAAGGEELVQNGSYAQKINEAVAATSESLVFLGADDLTFHPGWLDAASARLTGRIGVVGVNDTIRRDPERRGHATHFLLTRAYAQIPTLDRQRGPLFEGYAHNFCDDELIATARKRDAYAYAPDALVEHHHPMNGTATDDATYELGRAGFQRDRRLHRSRRRLWIR